MTRREYFALLASLPFVGKLFQPRITLHPIYTGVWSCSALHDVLFAEQLSFAVFPIADLRLVPDEYTFQTIGALDKTKPVVWAVDKFMPPKHYLVYYNILLVNPNDVLVKA